MQDYWIGRATFCSETPQSNAGADAVLIGANPNRCLLIVSAPDTGTLWLTTDSVATVGKGIALAAGSLPLSMDCYNYGNLPSKAWRVISDAEAALFSIFEGELSQARLREFEESRSNYG